MPAATIRVFVAGQIAFEFRAEEGPSLLEILGGGGRSGASISSIPPLPGLPESPCGGKGLCGRCRARVRGALSAPSREEVRHLSAKELAEGIRLLCEARPSTGKGAGDLVEVELPSAGEAAILTEGPRLGPLSDPWVEVPDSGPRYGLGIDLGTTTIAAYLVELGKGRVLGAASALNAQASFGADVISRIAAASSGRLSAMRDSAARQLTGLGLGLLARVGAGPEDLLAVAVAGNATMLHLLAGVDPGPMAQAPFIPAFVGGRLFEAGALGLGFAPSCSIRFLPGVAAYVGSDIVAGIAALGMAERPGPELLLDLGTNGELALGGSGAIWCCAAAAGPAFEGGGLECGMGGTEGAVDGVWLDGDSIRCSTIGRGPARGLCGSGALDALAAFLECGLIDPTGRIVDPEEARSLPPGLAALREAGAEGVRLRISEGLWLSQADVRELQLAIGAIAAGIEVLLSVSGIGEEEVGKLWLAGAFGAFLDLDSALRVGLVPAALGDRVEVAGNAAGAGAVAACASRARLAATEGTAALCRYVDLSSSPEFNEAFVGHLRFPEGRRPRSTGEDR